MTTSIKLNRVLIHGIAFNQAVNFIAHCGKYSITRAQVRFFMVCSDFPVVDRDFLVKYYTLRNVYRYFEALRAGGVLAKSDVRRQHIITDHGRDLIRDFWAEFSKLVYHFSR